MPPDLVPTADAASLGQGAPHRRRLSEAAWSQFQADEGGKGPLGRAAGCPAAPDRLGERVGVGQPVARGVRDNSRNPAFDEREQRFQPRECGLLFVGVLRLEGGRS